MVYGPITVQVTPSPTIGSRQGSGWKVVTAVLISGTT